MDRVKSPILAIVAIGFAIAIMAGRRQIKTGARAAIREVKQVTTPGTGTSSLDALDPETRARWLRLRDALAEAGYPDWDVLETWRDLERQEFYLENDKTTTLRSMHMHTAEGAPSSYALDLSPQLRKEDDRAEAFLMLRDLAPIYGFESGGSWTDGPREGRYHAYGLGWDAGHIERDDRTKDDIKF